VSETLARAASTASPHSATLASGEPLAPSRVPRADAALLFALTVTVVFFNLGAHGLWEPDESRYAEIAREMLESQNWIVPHLNYVIYVEKPPLLYWLVAAAFSIFGGNEFAARLVSALAAVVTVFATYLFALGGFGRRTALLAGTMLAVSPLFAAMAQVVTTDLLLTALTTVALFSLFAHWKHGGIWCWLAYVAMALGVLAKGPVAVLLPVASLAAFLWWQGGLRSSLRRFHFLGGAVVVAAIAAPWFVAVAMRVPGFMDFYFVGEHFRRFFEVDYSHAEPAWFYLPVLLVGLFPWSLAAPFAQWRRLAPNSMRLFAVVSAATIVVMFSLASAKLITYILPALPVLAVLAGDAIARLTGDEDASDYMHRFPLMILAAALLTSGVAAIIAGTVAPQIRSPYPMYLRPALYELGTVLLAGGAIAATAIAIRKRSIAVGAAVVTMAFAILAGTHARLLAEPLRSYADLSRTVAARDDDATIVSYYRYVQSLPFYAGRRVVLVGPTSELRFGAERAPDANQYFLSGDDELLAQWNGPRRVILVIDRPELEKLRDRLGPFRVIAAEHRKVAIQRSDFRDAAD
jgi:4-amino-4-deoxy-L-arabinose transferase-like glycosyltransferase